MSQKKALLIIDVQYDFLPGGSLAVNEGEKIIPLINQLKKEVKWDLVVLSQDWHPKCHKSFSSEWAGKKDIHGKEVISGSVHEINCRGPNETLWPDHCVQGSHGAEFSAELEISKTDIIVKKGTNPEIDSYSAFADNSKSAITELYNVLDSHGITDVYVCGLATDFCVYFTCLDATVRKDGSDKPPYKTTLIEDACRGVFAERSKQVVGEIQHPPHNVRVLKTSDVLR
eukprot:Phypoly_transcript_15968.p1 GENE.Phypoly_transcript_15968~~Phypoly_transcript_15968.p1  ORF type:complete len:228 (+),score=30.95 Phypoly_transcript_15968:165-848(+)